MNCQLISLSEDLLRYLFDYLNYYEQIQLILTNTLFTRTFLDSIRKIKRSISIKIKDDITKLRINERLLSLVRDPYHQVEIRENKCDEAVLDLDPDMIEGLAPLQAVSVLKSQGLSFMKRFRYTFNRIQTLWLKVGFKQSPTLLEYVRERSESLKLENLEIEFDDTEEEEEEQKELESRMMLFPFIVSLFSLKLKFFSGTVIPSQYGGLRKLILAYCPSLEDVSLFGNIYELTLDSCNSVKDISALKNNHTIVISWCYRIEDYSHSFENSVNISVYSEGSYEKRMCFGNLNRVRSIQMDGPKVGYRLTQNVGFQGLRYLSLSSNPNVCSVEGFGSIPVLELQYLQSLSSLKGLGKGNRKVSINECHGVTDFSPLRFIDTVEIMQCIGFRNAAHIDHVKNVKLVESWIDYGRITRTINLTPLGKHVQQLYLHFENKNSFSLTGLKNIPVIEVGFDSDIKSMMPTLKKLFAGNHQKIILRDGRKDALNTADLDDPKLMKKVVYNRYDMVRDERYGYKDKVIVFLKK